MPTDYTRYIPEYQSGGITPVSSLDDLPESLKSYYTANPIDWSVTGTPATKTNVSDLLAAVETPVATPEVVTEPAAAQYTAATDYGTPAVDATTTVANVLTQTPELTPTSSTSTATTASPAASTYQASTAYSSDKKKKSKLPYDSILFEAQTSEIL